MIRNEIGQPNFIAIPDIAYKKDSSGVLLMIPPQFLMIQYVRYFYTCKLGSIGDIKIRETYGKLCENRVLKEEFKIVERKGLPHALDFLNVFKTGRIKIVLRKIHDNSIWLDNGLVNIMNTIVHIVKRYPTLDWPKTMRSESKEVIEKNTWLVWNKRGMKIATISDPLVSFAVRIISHKFYQSIKLNSISCVFFDMGYKIVKKDHTHDLVVL